MPETDTRRDSATFANQFALHSFAGSARGGEDFAEQYARYASDSAQLLQQISKKAPQLASVLEELNEGCAQRSIALGEADAPAAPRARSMLLAGLSLPGQLLAGIAALLHGGRMLPAMKMIKNNKQA
ncbi:hypothetical protein ABIC71_001027 [Herbaspirillum seropedicae]|jgi:hypothetical protein|uniref:hypothetical protein n=1 Tax=Herbaspirillum seropedicae TaxID=964 RepID=UPI003390BDBD